jgi:nucleoside-diphosphate-sugar epimerase
VFPLNPGPRRRALVTGVGFFSRHLIGRLLADNAEVVVIGRGQQPMDLGACTWISEDLTRLTPDTWRAHGIEFLDEVFHLASFTPKSGQEADDVDRIFADSVLATRSLLKSLAGMQPRFLFTSTLDVYGRPTSSRPIAEDDGLNPGNLYAASKVYCEHMVRASCERAGYESCVLRVGHLYGPGEGHYRKLIPETIRRLRKGERPMVYGDGSAQTDLLYVEDAAAELVRVAAQRPLPAGPINLCGPSVSLLEVVETLVELSGWTGGLEILHDKPNPESLQLDDRRLREVLGQRALTPLREGLRRELGKTTKECVE